METETDMPIGRVTVRIGRTDRMAGWPDCCAALDRPDGRTENRYSGMTGWTGKPGSTDGSDPDGPAVDRLWTVDIQSGLSQSGPRPVLGQSMAGP